MEFTVLTTEFSKTLQSALRFVSSRATLPILSSVKLKSEGASLMVIATDLEMSMVGKIGAQVVSEGECAVPAKQLAEIISNLSTREVSLKIEKELLVIYSEGFKATLATSGVSEFPAVTVVAPEGGYILSFDSLSKALKRVLFAVGVDEARPIFTGVLFSSLAGKLRLVATDGFRLSKFEMGSLGEGVEDFSFVVPRKILGEIGRFAADNVTFKYSQEEKTIIFGLGEVVVTSRVIEGNYPNFEKIIPKNHECSVNVSLDDLSRIVKMAQVFARQSSGKLTLAIGESTIKVGAESTGLGETLSEVSAKVEGDPFEMYLNGKYLEDCLAVITSESVDLKGVDANSALQVYDPSESNFLHLVMPLKG